MATSQGFTQPRGLNASTAFNELIGEADIDPGPWSL